MKLFALLLLTLVAACVHGQTLVAQQFPPLTPATPDSIRDQIDLTIRFPFCQRVPTRSVLGYSSTGATIYLNTCSGLCLSAIFAPSECMPTYKYIAVYTSPDVLSQLTSLRFVRQVTACSCKPKRCKVSTDNGDVYYNHGAIVIDGCERRCTCLYGRLSNCCRQRKEFRLGLTTAEKQRYLDAVKLVSTTAPYKAQYDALIQKHATLFGSGIHGGPLFMPWHREYIWDLENILRQVDCRITVPYWRWSLEAANPFASTIWANSPSGFGGNGSPCVTGGPFAAPWQTTQPACLQRNFNMGATYATEADITQVLDVTCPLSTQFNCMRSNIESFHNYVHTSIGGQMTSIHSSNDPIFFMHHTYIDRIWARWQAKSAAHEAAYSGAPGVTMPGSIYTPADWLDLDRQANNPANRVCYIDPPVFWWLDAVLAVPAAVRAQPTCPLDPIYGPVNYPNYNYINQPCMSTDRLEKLPRIPLTPFPSTWLRTMGMNEKEIAAELDRHNQRNNATLVNLIKVEEARITPGVTSSIGFYLYDSDYECLNKYGGGVQYALGGTEPDYAGYDYNYDKY